MLRHNNVHFPWHASSYLVTILIIWREGRAGGSNPQRHRGCVYTDLFPLEEHALVVVRATSCQFKNGIDEDNGHDVKRKSFQHKHDHSLILTKQCYCLKPLREGFDEELPC